MARYGDKNQGGRLKSLFGNARSAKKPSISKLASSSSMDTLASSIESADYIRAEVENKNRVVPTCDFANPANFAKYGSAKEYYRTSVERIYKTYPYDGSKKEKIQWELSSSYLDNYILENEYPRTNGYINFDPDNGGFTGASDKILTINEGLGTEIYTLPNSPQYISIKGGPNQAQLPAYEQDLDKAIDFKNPAHKANFYDASNKREKNISINGEEGNTIEFWFKTGANLNRTKAIADVWNSDGTLKTQIGSASYGRILLESRVAGGSLPNSSIFHLTYMSGTTGAERVPLFSTTAVGTPSNGVWNHFAVTIKNSGDNLNIKSFINGQIVDNLLTGSTVSEVTGSTSGGINCNIGGYLTYPNEAVKAGSIVKSISDFNGFGNLTASFDEFRFWKTARSEDQIKRYWFTQVGAGANTDTSNTDLGFYFKFNEGVTGDINKDRVVLDYSGRVSNGTFHNYSTASVAASWITLTSTSRETGSAMVAAEAAEREFKDPIIYPTHPSVDSYKSDAMHKGELWDNRNSSYIFKTLPSWIQDEDALKNRNSTLALTQIMASYFDTLHLQIEEMRKIKTNRYLSSSADTTVKPFPYAYKLLTNAGFVAPEIFADTDVISSLTHADNHREYEKKLYDIKNYIYQNIYNNLVYINKSKGTHKAIRNLIRCFGVDEEIYKVNMYADNAEYTLTNNFVDKTIRKTYADFNDVTRNNATVYTYKNSSESNNLGFITGSTDTTAGFDRFLAMTVEAEVILPRKPPLGEPNAEKKYFADLTSSLFGMHSAKIVPGADAATVTTWDSNDYANFQVYAVSDTNNKDRLASRSVKFILKSHNSVLPELTSSLYLDQYQDTKWNFAVRVKPIGYPSVASGITGSAGKSYDVEFEGISTTSDIVINNFKATGTISNAAGLNFITQKKRMYVGAHRTNFTGGVLERSDALLSSCRYWAEDITSEELKFHAIDPQSYGVFTPTKNAYLFSSKGDAGMEVPRIKTLVQNWEFDTITGSNSNGRFVVKDSSYTINQDANYQLWDSSADFSNLLETNHDARGDYFEASNDNSTLRDFIPAYKQQLPENINDSNMITVATTDDLTYTKNTLPVTFSFALEKSMYQSISEEMIKFFAVSKDASSLDNLLGDPVNRYRSEYKGLEKARNLFFNMVGNTPDLEKYLNYYKWLDKSISDMVKQLTPASAKIPDVTNVIESHILERGGKYQNRFPTLEFKSSDPEDAMRGVNELKYNWRLGHAPTPPTAIPLAAAGTIQINSTPDTEHVVAITSTAGVTKTYVFMDDGVESTGELDSGSITVQLDGVSGVANIAAELQTAINHANGHNAGVANSVINISRVNGILSLTQVVKGAAGNQAITWNGGAAQISLSGFVNGADSEQGRNCLWWNKRALRNEAGLSSGDSNTDASRMQLHSASLQVFNRNLDSPVSLDMEIVSKSTKKSALNKKQVVFAATPPNTGKNLKFNTSEFSVPEGCDDVTSVDPQFKFKPQFKVEGSSFQGRSVSPYSFYSASSDSRNTILIAGSNGYFELNGYDLTKQHLRDYYVDTKNIPMQGPFTEQHVGGYQYRHVGLQIGMGTYKPEGWWASVSGSSSGSAQFIIYSPSAVSSGYPRATFSRDHIAKSPLNIKNIRNITSSNSSYASAGGTTTELGTSIALGNYSHDYEIVQIPGRSINNNYFARSSGIATSSAEWSSIQGLYDREIPDRGKNKHVFVNKFSAPGGPETMGAGFLDYESESFSVYNALPYRNLSVRQPLRTLLTRHSAFGGYDGVNGSPTASYHQTQRNGAKRLKINGAPEIGSHSGLGLNLATGTMYDNAFVQHMIPRSDMQYAWITASATGSVVYGYTRPNNSNASMASTDLNFVSQSQIGIFNDGGTRKFGYHSRYVAESKFIAQDFVGLNKATKLVDSKMDENIVQYEANATFATESAYQPQAASYFLNYNLLRSQGAGGHSSWKQIRQTDHPLVRRMRNTNRYSLVKEENSSTENSGAGPTFLKEQKLVSYIEPPVSSKYKPLKHQLELWNYEDSTGKGAGGPEVVIKSSYGNNLAYYTQTNTVGVNSELYTAAGAVRRKKTESITKISGFNPTYERQLYDDLKGAYLNEDRDNILPGLTPVKKATAITYREVVYPKESYTFLSGSRRRLYYTEPSGSPYFAGVGRGITLDNVTGLYSFIQKATPSPYGMQKTFWRNQKNARLRPLGYSIYDFFGGNPNQAPTSGYILNPPLWFGSKNSMGIPTAPGPGNFKSTSYENVIDMSCWPLDASYPMVDIAPSGSGSFVNDAQTVSTASGIGEGEGSMGLPSTYEGKSRNGELSYNNWIYNLYRVPIQGLGTGGGSISTLSASSPITASLSYEYPNFVLSGSDPNKQDQPYTMAHLSLIPDWTANLTSSRNPWFDTYEEYSKDISRIGKDYTIIPEFRISDHIPYYLKEGFTAPNFLFLDLPGAIPMGAKNITSSAWMTDPDPSFLAPINESFYRVYTNSDFMKHFDVIKEEHQKSFSSPDSDEPMAYIPTKVRLKCKGIKKLLPYQGFYPALRTVQLGTIFSASFGDFITGNYDQDLVGDTNFDRGDMQSQALSSLIQPFFAPGILYNTIKGGVAVDWPVITGSIQSKTPPSGAFVGQHPGTDGLYGYRAAGICNFDPDWRMPFEALMAPEKYLPIDNDNLNLDTGDRPAGAIYHIWPNYSGMPLSQSAKAKRFSPVQIEEYKAWYDHTADDGASLCGYMRPTPNFKWTGQHRPEYHLAMNNFLAETVDFFLEGQTVTTFTSGRQSAFRPFASGTTYFMDVVMSKTSDFKMYEGPENNFNIEVYCSGSSSAPTIGASTLTASVSARGMHYGPYFSSKDNYDDRMYARSDRLAEQVGDPGPAPYTPPYFYGTSIARVTFRPHVLRDMAPGEASDFTLSEIFSSAQYETTFINLGENSRGFFQNTTKTVTYTGRRGSYTRTYTNPSATGSAAYRNQMTLDSSLNLFNRTGKKRVAYVPTNLPDGTVKYKANGLFQGEDEGSQNDVWVIESKFECPTMNYANHDSSSYDDGSGEERHATTGPWKTFGQLPDNESGIFLALKESFPQLENATEAQAQGSISRQTVVNSERARFLKTTGSLLQHCNFQPQQKRVGALASSKEISEAIVAIPMNTNGSFVPINKLGFNRQKANLESDGIALKAGDFGGEIKADIQRTSISDMINRMKKYVIPPHLDFLHNQAVYDKMGPFVMYIFEFNHTLSKSDLSLIWQNMMPDISVTAEMAESSIEHSVLTGEKVDFFGVDSSFFSPANESLIPGKNIFSDKLRWMVFKVKKRAKNNYAGVSITNDSSKGFEFDELDAWSNDDAAKLNPSGKQAVYSYNWPYDFFSLVELAQLEPAITFNPVKLKDAQAISDTAIAIAGNSPATDYNPSPDGGGGDVGSWGTFKHPVDD